MNDKLVLKYFDPQITVKDKAAGDRLQFIPSTKIPIIGKKHFESWEKIINEKKD